MADGSYEQAIFAALRQAMDGRRYAAKTLMRWTGASPRTAKHWLAGSTSPGGADLIELMRSSDIIFDAVLRMAGRGRDTAPGRMADVSELLKRAVGLLEDGA